MAGSELIKGTIIKLIAGFYYVDAGTAVYMCRAKGKFRDINESPLPGDSVIITPEADFKGRVESIVDRRNCFVRPTVANVDRLYIVASSVDPSPNLSVIDRMTVIAEHKGAEPVIVFNKADLRNIEELSEVYLKAGFQTFIVSAKTGEGIAELKDSFSGKLCVLTGNSGVGKSSLLNLVFPDAGLSTGEISDKLGRGRHTTRAVELLKTGNGGYIADTPGFSILDFVNEGLLKDELAGCFREFAPYLSGCRFTTCSHTKENGCAILAAVERGEIPKSRHDSYFEMYNELKNVNEWELKKRGE